MWGAGGSLWVVSGRSSRGDQRRLWRVGARGGLERGRRDQAVSGGKKPARVSGMRCGGGSGMLLWMREMMCGLAALLAWKEDCTVC